MRTAYSYSFLFTVSYSLFDCSLLVLMFHMIVCCSLKLFVFSFFFFVCGYRYCDIKMLQPPLCCCLCVCAHFICCHSCYSHKDAFRQWKNIIIYFIMSPMNGCFISSVKQRILAPFDLQCKVFFFFHYDLLHYFSDHICAAVNI